MPTPCHEDEDVCLTCGKKVPQKIWSSSCEKGHTTVHQYPCSACGTIIGFVGTDDFCGPEYIICSECMKNAGL